MTWREMGACWESFDPDFFPDPGADGAFKHSVRAKTICATCSVTDDCLAYALETKAQNGIWGGKTVRELRGMR